MRNREEIKKERRYREIQIERREGIEKENETGRKREERKTNRTFSSHITSSSSSIKDLFNSTMTEGRSSGTRVAKAPECT